VRSAVAQAIEESFPYVRVFGSVEHWGNHILASNQPIPDLTPKQLVEHMPAKAVADMMEWGPASTPTQQFAAILDSEFPLDRMISDAPNAPALQDDRPVNEYFALRRKFPTLINFFHLGLVGAPH
jgi:hypothetical protein